MFSPNSTAAQTVTVAITYDDLVEATETFVASLTLDESTSLTGYAKDLTDTATGYRHRTTTRRPSISMI